MDLRPQVAARRLQIGAPVNRGPPSAAAVSPIQRKMGFEFETGNKYYWKKEGEWFEPGRRKGDPMYRGAGFKIEGDTESTPEVIIDAEDSWARLAAAINAADTALETINKKPAAGGPPPRRVMTTADSANWLHETAFNEDLDEAWLADMQVTQGVRLAHLPTYLDDHLSRDEQKALAKRRDKIEAGDLPPAVAGFLDLVVQFVADFKDWDGADNEEGPKNAQAFMARNPYSKMLGAMSKKDQAAFKGMFFDGDAWLKDNPVTRATDVKGGDRVIPNRYSDGAKSVAETTTLKQWLEAMCGDVDAADPLSPPTGWRGGNYGMGLMEVDRESVPNTPLALLEYRRTDNRTEMGETSGKSVPVYSWLDLAKEHYDKAADYDESLGP